MDRPYRTRTTARPGGVTKGQYSFAQVPSVGMPRSAFNRSHGLKTAIYPAYLYPCFVDEALPGDTMNLRAAAFARIATLIKPIMDNIFLDFFFFAVPIRLIWDNWQKFNGEQTDPGDSTAYTVPVMTETVAQESLSDYMGLPIGSTIEFNSLHHRAYNLIFKEWFRSEDLTDSPVVDTDDGPDTPGDYVLRKRTKRHDYFTSCLPFTQKGDAVELPLGSTAPVVSAGDGEPAWEFSTGGARHLQKNASDPAAYWEGSGITGIQEAAWHTTALEADLSSATASTINEIREAFQIQKMLERDARGGSRYTEIIRSHFGVVSPDQRLQRPEYLGGGTSRVNIHPVALTLGAVGDLGAYGTSIGDNIGFVKSFTEHCVLLGLCNIRADITYQQGINRMFSRQTRYDYYWPSLAHLGEQAVLNKELYADGSANDDLVFGYQERYAEYRYKPSQVTGPMRSDHLTSLDHWHLALDFASLPALNNTFIEDDPPFSRVQYVGATPSILADFYFDYKCVRPMPTFSVPGLVDHF